MTSLNLESELPKLTLKEIAEFYRDNFVGEILTYDVRHKSTPFIIKFDEGHLMHLLALNKFGYKRGEKIYRDLLQGKITYHKLEKINKGKFKEHYFRMRYFCCLGEVMKDPKIIVYDRNRTESVIEADFVFYSQIFDRFLSLAIRKESKDSVFYAPVTFLESEKNKWTNQRHILFQTK